VVPEVWRNFEMDEASEISEDNLFPEQNEVEAYVRLPEAPPAAA
jgi:hypothetical protein